MDRSQYLSIGGCRLPGWALLATLILLLWLPGWSAIHFGQVTVLLTAILALGVGREPLAKGFCVGLVVALKPTYVFLILPAAVGFGGRAILGMALGLCPILIDYRELMTYLSILPHIAQNDFAGNWLMNLLGKTGSIGIVTALSTAIAWKTRGREDAYVLPIGLVTLGVAFWFHSYVPMVIPLTYYLGRWVRLAEEAVHS